MNDFFGKNLGWKIFSIILAIGLWFVVINIKNPEETMAFTIPVEIQNIDKVTFNDDLIIANIDEIQDKYITLNIRGTRLTLEELKNNRKYLNIIKAKANLDLYRYTKASEINKIPIEITFSDEYKGLIYEERNQIRYLDLVLEERKSITKPILGDIIGQIDDGYVVLEPKVNPGEITITGAESLINKVDVVKVEVNVNDILNNRNISLEPKIYDSQGKEIIGLNKTIKTVKVSAEVGKKRKVTLIPNIEGNYAENYISTGVKIEPEEIVIVGNEETIDHISQVQLSTIIFDHLDKTTVFNPTLILPAGVTRWDSTDNSVSVTIEVKKQIVKEFVIPTSRLTLRTEKQFKYISKEVTLYLFGIEDEVQKITENTLQGSIDVSNLGEGHHKVPIKFNFPGNIKQVGEPPIVEIELIEGEEEPEGSNDEVDEEVEKIQETEEVS